MPPHALASLPVSNPPRPCGHLADTCASTVGDKGAHAGRERQLRRSGRPGVSIMDMMHHVCVDKEGSRDGLASQRSYALTELNNGAR